MVRSTGRENNRNVCDGTYVPISYNVKCHINCTLFRLVASLPPGNISTIEQTTQIRIPFWVFLILGALYFCAVRVDIMDIDASQYAEISREMARSNDFLHIYDRGYDYVDKPPFLFWVTALSIKAFGATPFAYRLPTILFAFLAIYATYRLTRLLYNESVARI